MMVGERKVQQRGRLVGRYVAENRNGGPVNFNAWILMKAFPAIMDAARRRVH
jgi:hypothetical protein